MFPVVHATSPVALQVSNNFQFWFFVCFLQEETDSCMVELQDMVQSVAHAEAEIQQMLNLLQDLESGFNGSKQRQEEVRSSTQSILVLLTISPHLPLLLTPANIISSKST